MAFFVGRTEAPAVPDVSPNPVPNLQTVHAVWLEQRRHASWSTSMNGRTPRVGTVSTYIAGSWGSRRARAVPDLIATGV